MSDLSGLHGVYPTSLRWNAESGFLSISVFNPESGERELREIELGQTATFAMDLATRERGYGLIKVGLYDMRLTPVGSPPPPCPDDEEFKPALGCWLWNPSFGELRFETNGAIVRQAMMAVWDACKGAPEAATGLQPVICCADSAPRTIARQMSARLMWRGAGGRGWARAPPTTRACRCPAPPRSSAETRGRSSRCRSTRAAPPPRRA